jgi:hypothetical protein
MSEIIPFYGASDPDRFEIERRCMDRVGKLTGCLDDRLPHSQKDRHGRLGGGRAVGN